MKLPALTYDLDSPLKFIAGKEATQILLDPDGRKILDDLLKYELIEIEDENIVLTLKGTEALKIGVDTFLIIHPDKENLIQLQVPVPVQKSNKTNHWILLLFGGFLLLLLFLFNFENFSKL